LVADSKKITVANRGTRKAVEDDVWPTSEDK